MLKADRLNLTALVAVVTLAATIANAQPTGLSNGSVASKSASLQVEQSDDAMQIQDLLAGQNKARALDAAAYDSVRAYKELVGAQPTYGGPRNPTGDLYNIDMGLSGPDAGIVGVQATLNDVTFGPPNPQQSGAFLNIGAVTGLDGQIYDVTETATDLGDGVFRYDFTLQLRVNAFPGRELFPGNILFGGNPLPDGVIFLGDTNALTNPNGHRVVSYSIRLFDVNDALVAGPFDALGTLANNSPWDGDGTVVLPEVSGLGTTRIAIEMIVGKGGQPGPFGACCLPGLDCVDSVTETQCNAGGGVYQGDGSVCATTDCFVVPGACCDTRTGVCVDGVDVAGCAPTLRDAFFNRFLSANSVCNDFDPPCAATSPVVVCQLNDIVEGETECTINDEFNSGCFSNANPGGGAFNLTLTAGDTVCGTGGNDITADGATIFNESDWYKFVTVAAETQVTFTIEAEFEGLVGVINTGGVDACPGNLAFVSGAAAVFVPGQEVMISACVPPGTWIIAVLSDLDIFSPCGADLAYRLSYDAVSPCITVECPPGSNGTPPNGQANGATGVLASTSDRRPDLGFAVADNFSPSANSQVSQVTWWGFYNDPGFENCSDGSLGTPNDDDWQITYYRNDDLNDLPGTLLAGPFSVNATKAATGRLVAGQAEVEFSATHAPVDFTANRCYWVEISNNTTGCFTTISTTTGADDRSAQRIGDTYVPGDENDWDLGVCLNTGLRPDGCASSTDFEGACCLPQLGGTDANGCAVLPFGDCIASNGIFAGFDTTCAETNCSGACCTGIDACSIVTYEACFSVTNNNSYAFQGIGTDCSDSPCAGGACCFVDGLCQDTTSTGGFPPVFESNCSPIVVSTTAPNIWDRTGQPLPMSAIGGFTSGAACDFITQAPCPQPNIGLATTIACNNATTFNTLGLGPAGASGGEGVFDQPDLSCIGGAPPEVDGAFWVTFTATAMQTQISTCGSLVNDTVLAVYEETTFGGDPNQISEANEIICNDDADNPCGGDVTNFNAEVCIDTNIGQQYWVQVGSFTPADQGVIEVAINCSADVCDVAVCATCTGDVNGDNSRDGRDVQAFTADILGAANNPCSDFNGSGGTDLGDIPGFVSAVLGGGC